MTELQLELYIKAHYSKENERCEWKAFSNLKNAVAGSAGEDVISYVSSISNMEGAIL
jgi:ATP-dependent DNA helicase RecG